MSSVKPLTNQRSLPFVLSDLKYGDTVFFLIIYHEEYSLKCWIQSNTWTGDTRQYQLFEKGLCFNSEHEAINKFNKIVNTIYSIV